MLNLPKVDKIVENKLNKPNIYDLLESFNLVTASV